MSAPTTVAPAPDVPSFLGFPFCMQLDKVEADIVEITPGRDVNGITALTAGQLILNYIGAAVRAGYFEES